MVFKVFQKLFTTLYNYLLFILLLWNNLLILKMLSEPLLRISSHHWLQEKSRELTCVTGGIREYLKVAQAASCKHFQCLNRRFRVFKAGYWKDFQN
jgi:hypothetical protein